MAVATREKGRTAYEWVTEYSGRFDRLVDPDTLGRTFEEIRERDGGVTPAALLEEATPEDHPCHAVVFDRSQEDAARAFFLNRCMKLIVSVRRVDGAANVPEYVHVRVDEWAGYVQQADLVRADYRKSATDEAKAYLAGARRRYGWVKELADVWKAIDDLG